MRIFVTFSRPFIDKLFEVAPCARPLMWYLQKALCLDKYNC